MRTILQSTGSQGFGLPGDSQMEPPSPRTTEIKIIFALAAATVVLMALLSVVNTTYLGSRPLDCVFEALTSKVLSSEKCEANLKSAVLSAVSLQRKTKENSGFGAEHALSDFRIARLSMWADNLLVDIYTALFIVSASAAYKRITTVKSDPIFIWRAAITATAITALLGALADHCENFWLLSHMIAGGDVGDFNPQLPTVSQLSAWKARLFVINLLVLAGWWLAARKRQRWADERFEKIAEILISETTEPLSKLLKLDDGKWPEEIAYGTSKMLSHNPWLWQGVFYFHFINLIKSNGRLRYSFSHHAVDNWLRRVCNEEKDIAKKQMYRDDLKSYMNYLSNQGYLSPKGKRYEIAWSTFPFSNVSVELAKFNFQVFPGDVLLLYGSGKSSWPNVAAQSALRLRRAHFSHVAIALNDSLIVDAMPGVGVSIRKWHDIESSYDVSKCMVARHSGLASDSEAQTRLLQRAVYYYKTRWTLTALLNNDKRPEDKSGMVCSHFVAFALADLGIYSSAQEPLSTLPFDLEEFTKGTPWRQFSFQEYGLFSNCPRPPLDDEYWVKLKKNVRFELSDNQRSIAEKDALDIVEGVASNAPEDWAKRLDETGLLMSTTTLLTGKSILSEINDAITKNVENIDAMHGTMAELRIALSKIDDNGVAYAFLRDADPLAQWTALFFNVHPQAKASLRHSTEGWLVEQRGRFLEQIKGARSIVQQILDDCESRSEMADRFTKLIKNSPSQIHKIVELSLALENQLLTVASNLCDIDSTVLQVRLDSYETVLDDYLQWVHETNQLRSAEATSALIVANELDHLRLAWIDVQRPSILRRIEIYTRTLRHTTDI